MSWQALILISSAFSAISTILNRKFMEDKKLEPVAYATLFQFVCAAIFLVMGIFSGKMFGGDLLSHWPNFLLQGVLYGVGSIFMFKSLKLGEASKFTVIFSTQSLFTIIGAFLFLGETLLPIHWIAVLLLLGSVVLVSFTPDSINFDKDEWYALFAAICFGFARVNDKILIGQMDFYTFLFLGFLLPGIFMLVWNPHTFKEIKLYKKVDNLRKLVVVAIFYAINAIAFYWALSIGKSSQVVTAAVTSVIFTEVLSIAFLGERKNIMRKVAGSLLTIVGLVLISV